MRDPRSTKNPEWVTGATPAQVKTPVADLLRRPNGPRDRQMLFGETATILGTQEGYSYLITDKDGYVGFVQSDALGSVHKPTHWVHALATHCYVDARMKSADLMTLSHGSKIKVLNQNRSFVETHVGFIPIQHVKPLSEEAKDPVESAKLYLGTPYLWGGNSRLGIDCSGLVQAALTSCGQACPGDSDQQEAALGTKLPEGGSAPRRGDVMFWKGHVALIVNETTLIHANAHHMAVVFEDITTAIQRIAQQGDGPVTGHIRL